MAWSTASESMVLSLLDHTEVLTIQKKSSWTIWLPYWDLLPFCFWTTNVWSHWGSYNPKKILLNHLVTILGSTTLLLLNNKCLITLRFLQSPKNPLEPFGYHTGIYYPFAFEQQIFDHTEVLTIPQKSSWTIWLPYWDLLPFCFWTTNVFGWFRGIRPGSYS